MSTSADIVVDFCEEDLAELELEDKTGESDRLVPFHFSPSELDTVSLERRFAIGIVDGPVWETSGTQLLTIDITLQWRTEKESRARMLRDLSQILRRVKRWNSRFEVAHEPGLEPPTIESLQYDYTSVLGVCFVTITVGLKYRVLCNT